MGSSFWEVFTQLSLQQQIYFAVALLIAFGFEFINGFHDTANAVTTVIYTRTLRPTPAVIFSGVCNFLGVLLGGTAVAFAIVNLLPVDLLIQSSSVRSIVMVLSLLLAGMIWNLGTWWYGLPVSSSHTLIGSILGVGLANSLITRHNLSGVNWSKATEVGMSLLISPIIGFVAAAGLLLLMKRLFRDPSLYRSPDEGDHPPRWIRYVLLGTCGGVSFAHGSNDGQKGIGLILLALIGFLPAYCSLNMHSAEQAADLRTAAMSMEHIFEKEPGSAAASLMPDLQMICAALDGKVALADVPPADRWMVRQAILRIQQRLGKSTLSPEANKAVRVPFKQLVQTVEYVPFWVILGVALALGVGTTIGYRRIVVTIAEKIGKAPLTYAQGATAEIVAAATIGLADIFHMPVSTTHVLSSGVAGTMCANRSGVQMTTVKRIGLAWVLTLPAAILLSASLFTLGGYLIPGASPALAVALSAIVPGPHG
ncbi:MAG TPA: inorganic phosphate transporter [Pirellulales bacterium]|nr:inorganic phosphate transporter [Pirellulales bacterium]